jgi:hypothetical protein
LVGEYEGKRRLERPTCRGEDNIKVDRREIGWEGIDYLIWTWIRAGGGLL